MNSENNETSDSHGLLTNISDKIHLKRKDKFVALSNFSICYTRKNVKKSSKNNNIKISTPRWNERHALPDS